MDEINLSELRNECLTSLYSCTDNISTYLDNESERTEAYNVLRNCVKEYCKMEHQEEAGRKALQSLEEETDFTDWEIVKQQYESKLSQYTKQHIKYDTHPFMKELEKYIEIAQRSHRVQNLGQDLAITEITDRHIDPISKRPISHPMRNIICNHVYDKESIESIVRNKKNRGCPYLGCTNKQTMVPPHLRLDEALLLIIRKTQESQSQEEL